MDPKGDVLDTMAQLVLEEPAITVRALAARLGFSQERSVYYWLAKAGYRGLRPFRTAVLKGRYPVSRRLPRPAGVREGGRSVLTEVPLLLPTQVTDSPPAPPSAYVVTDRALSSQAFAVTVDTGEYRPFVDAGDILLVDPKAPLADGDWVLVRAASGPALLRRIYGKEGAWLVHPAEPRSHLRLGSRGEPPEIIGKVVGLHREL